MRKKIQWAKERIQELDRIKEKEIDGHNEFLKEEGDTTKRKYRRWYDADCCFLQNLFPVNK